jgi:iron-sulfur cluster repair protein YtfE (RIC family)
MEQFIYSGDVHPYLIYKAEGVEDSQQVLFERIKDQHVLILDKLLPEIDMHFSAVLKCKSAYDHTLKEAHASFCQFSELLRDHIYMEDYIVFPELVLEEKPMVFAIRDFVEHHDDFELMIHELLRNISESLKPLQELLPFRILLLKMARLELLLAEHNELEDLLFKDFH